MKKRHVTAIASLLVAPLLGMMLMMTNVQAAELKVLIGG